MRMHPVNRHAFTITSLILTALLTVPGCSRSDGQRAEKTSEKQTGKAASATDSIEIVENRDRAPVPDRDRTWIPQILKPRTIDLQVPGGTAITIRLTSGASSQSSSIGDRVEGVIANDVMVDGKVAIPAGSPVSGSVTAAHGLRKIGGRASLALSLTRLTLPGGKEYPIQMAFSRIGKSETAKDTATIVGGAIAGAIIGHQIDDEHDGRTVGGVVGAGAGTVIAAKTKGETIELPAGTKLKLTLQNPLDVTVKVER